MERMTAERETSSLTEERSSILIDWARSLVDLLNYLNVVRYVVLF